MLGALGKLRMAYRKASGGWLPPVNVFGYAATEAAYRHGEPWRQDLVEYLRGNHVLLAKYLREHHPELSLTPAYGKDPIQVGLVESLDLVARRDREGRIPRDLQGTWDWTVRHGDVSTGGWNPYLKEALQTMFETGLPAIVYEELTGEEYHPVDGARHIR